MTAKRKTVYLFLFSVLVFIVSILLDNSEKIGICSSMSCGDLFIFALGRPLLQLFSFLLPFTFLLSFFKEETLRFWFSRVIWTLPVPIIITFLTPMNCTGFLGCIPTREQSAWLTGTLYVGIFLLAILIHALRKPKQ